MRWSKLKSMELYQARHRYSHEEVGRIHDDYEALVDLGFSRREARR